MRLRFRIDRPLARLLMELIMANQPCPEWSEQAPFGISELKENAALRYSNKVPDSLLRGEELQCCIAGCQIWLPKRRRGKPPRFCPDHGLSMSIKPTYIYEKKERNLVVGHNLWQSGRIKKVENWRFGYETSEDALSWNVFVGLHVLNGLAHVFEKLTGIVPAKEPELYVWGNRIGRSWEDICSLPVIQNKDASPLRNYL